mmetsp:Transcript_13542/g.36206  ORF Transcript_13542/g.36206 Transcript_13542/m.36206 type:complete len:206 (-) Transcript_13542:982-1599(-)
MLPTSNAGMSSRMRRLTPTVLSSHAKSCPFDRKGRPRGLRTSFIRGERHCQLAMFVLCHTTGPSSSPSISSASCCALLSREELVYKRLIQYLPAARFRVNRDEAKESASPLRHAPKPRPSRRLLVRPGSAALTPPGGRLWGPAELQQRQRCAHGSLPGSRRGRRASALGAPHCPVGALRLSSHHPAALATPLAMRSAWGPSGVEG